MPVILVVGSLVVGLLLRALVISSGRRVGRKALRRYCDHLEHSIRIRLDQRIGTPIRARMRSRAEIAGALTELGIITATLEEQLIRSD